MYQQGHGYLYKIEDEDLILLYYVILIEYFYNEYVS